MRSAMRRSTHRWTHFSQNLCRGVCVWVYHGNHIGVALTSSDVVRIHTGEFHFIRRHLSRLHATVRCQCRSPPPKKNVTKKGKTLEMIQRPWAHADIRFVELEAGRLLIGSTAERVCRIVGSVNDHMTVLFEGVDEVKREGCLLELPTNVRQVTQQ